MRSNSITVEVSPEAALGYESATVRKRRFAQGIIEALFARKVRITSAELRSVAEQAHEEAVANGLTEEKLDAILNDE
jgi:hypothetical protein